MEFFTLFHFIYFDKEIDSEKEKEGREKNVYI